MNIKEGVLYKFETKTCNICKVMEPLYKEFVEKNDVEYQKVDANEEMDVCDKYGIMQLPTFMYVFDGEPFMISGLIDRKDFTKFTKDFIKTLP